MDSVVVNNIRFELRYGVNDATIFSVATTGFGSKKAENMVFSGSYEQAEHVMKGLKIAAVIT